MSTKYTPLSQFKIYPLIKLEAFGYDISFTNASLFMLLAVAAILLFFAFATRKAALIPTRLQSSAEVIYLFISSTLTDNAGPEAKKYFPLIFSVFLFILFCNLFGMLPYGFTVTSQIVVTFALAIMMFMAVTIIGFVRHGAKFLSLFLPSGTPIVLAPLMIVIEIFTYFARPITLSIRLAANMIAGHVLLKVFAGFVLMLGVMWGWLPIIFVVIFSGFELFVAILQAYIFTILCCVYLNDAINLHHD